MARGFGELIARKRVEAGLSQLELAKKLKRRSGSFVYRLENEEQEPDTEIINALVSLFPISAEQLLLAMGVHLIPPEVALQVPTTLAERWPSLHPDDVKVILGTVLRLTGGTDPGQEPAG